MICATKIKSFLFNGVDEKHAYIKGCKQLAKFTASLKYTNLFFKIERLQTSEHVFKFTLYSGLDMGQVQHEFCSVCKEIHTSFFMNENSNCERCNLKAYLKRLKQKANISKGFYKNEVERRM